MILTAVAPSIQVSAVARFQAAVSGMQSLVGYRCVQSRPFLHNRVHNSRVDADDAREWGLARCGHHPCSDGRSQRHLAQGHFACPLCHNSAADLVHVLLSCPGVHDLRCHWIRSVGVPWRGFFGSDAVLRWIFDPSSEQNCAATTAHHVQFVASCCRRFGLH